MYLLRHRDHRAEIHEVSERRGELTLLLMHLAAHQVDT